MSQFRRSARLASIRRAAQSSSVPEPIPLDDDDTDSLCSLPRDSPGCIECGFELESEDDVRVFSCCSSSHHLRCLAPLAVDQEVRFLDCPSEFVDHVSAHKLQRLCLINGVEWSCIPQLSCMEAMTVENSIQVPCCGQFVHTVCLARSFSSRGVDWQMLPDLRHFWLLLSSMGIWSILIVPFPIRRSIPSSFLMIFLLHFQSTLSVALASVALLSSNLLMTVVWSGHFFTRPLMARRRGFLSGSVVLVEHPLRFLTSLRWMQLRVLCVPLHLPSCLTDPLVVILQLLGILSTIQC